jgi:hypothetical protein
LEQQATKKLRVVRITEHGIVIINDFKSGAIRKHEKKIVNVMPCVVLMFEKTQNGVLTQGVAYHGLTSRS